MKLGGRYILTRCRLDNVVATNVTMLLYAWFQRNWIEMSPIALYCLDLGKSASIQPLILATEPYPSTEVPALAAHNVLKTANNRT